MILFFAAVPLSGSGDVYKRQALHREYVDSVLGSLKGHLDNAYVVDEKGNKTKLKKKEGQ